jgi:hypothetical protein
MCRVAYGIISEEELMLRILHSDAERGQKCGVGVMSV